MPRVKGGTISRARHKKVMKQAKGYFGSKHRLYRSANEQVMHAGKYAYRDRRQKKRDFRKLWITRINAACRLNDISYSKFINGLLKAGVEVNRKMLAEVAIDNPALFTEYANTAKKALEGKLETAKAEKTVKEVKVVAKEETKAETKKAPAKTTAAKKTTTTKKAEPKTEAKKPAAKKTTAAKTTTTKKATTTIFVFMVASICVLLLLAIELPTTAT